LCPGDFNWKLVGDVVDQLGGGVVTTWEDPYPNVREALAPGLESVDADSLEALLESAGLSAEDMEFNFGKALKAVGGIAQKALPIAGTVVGTAFGGPLGATLGGLWANLPAELSVLPSGQQADAG
jgi:hypothetical protein